MRKFVKKRRSFPLEIKSKKRKEIYDNCGIFRKKKRIFETLEELYKLSRRELLEMLLAQAKEAERLADLLAETQEQLHELEDTYERLRDRLDQKDLRIRTLRETLEEERRQREIEQIEAALLCPVIQIVGESMADTLQDGDIVVTINDSKFETGNVVAFYYNNNILIKRIIATADSWVDIDREGNVSVNGTPLDEPYVTDKALGECDITLPCQVPDDKIFVMGDHRATSVDSRSTAVGCISSDLVVGRILFRIWPLSEIGSIS